MGVIDGLRKESGEVLYRNARGFSLGKQVLPELCVAADKNPRRRIRICCHEGPESGVHEMIILHHRDAYIPPHRHLSRDESLIIISGEARLVFFSEAGALQSVTQVTDFTGGGSWFNKIDADSFHTLVIDSEWLLFLEVTGGPFQRDSTEWAKWAPAESWTAATLDPQCQEYLSALRASISK